MGAAGAQVGAFAQIGPGSGNRYVFLEQGFDFFPFGHGNAAEFFHFVELDILDRQGASFQYDGAATRVGDLGQGIPVAVRGGGGNMKKAQIGKYEKGAFQVGKCKAGHVVGRGRKGGVPGGDQQYFFPSFQKRLQKGDFDNQFALPPFNALFIDTAVVGKKDIPIYRKPEHL